jgi:hypothetical protein
MIIKYSQYGSAKEFLASFYIVDGIVVRCWLAVLSTFSTVHTFYKILLYYKEQEQMHAPLFFVDQTPIIDSPSSSHWLTAILSIYDLYA